MDIRSHFKARALSVRLGLAIVVVLMALGGVWAAMSISVTAQSGVPLPCHSYWRVDMQGKEWPVTIQYTARPANGSVHTQVTLQPKMLRNGTSKTVHVAQVVYQSKKGFIGQDSFTYRRISGDPTDPDNNKEYTIAVTVR
jgi:hypothetical protein